MLISDLSSDVCSSDLSHRADTPLCNRCATSSGLSSPGLNRKTQWNCMSHLTDKARAPYRGETGGLPGPDSLEAIVAENPTRRTLLRNGLFGLSDRKSTRLNSSH